MGGLQDTGVRALISLNKCSGLRLVIVGETWRWMLEKCVLEVAVAVAVVEAKEVFGTDQL